MTTTRRWLPDVVAAAVVLIVLAFVFWIARGRALDPIIDTGRDLYIPEHIRGGAKLYRDFLYYYPPAAPYALALITSVTGSSLAAYEWIGAAIALLTAAALYLLVRSAASAWTAGAAALMFAACSVYSISDRTSNYLIPYAHASTLAMLFFVAGGAFLLMRRRALALIALFLASWTKIEYAAFSALLIVLFAILDRLRVRLLIAYALAAVLSIGLVSWYFADAQAHWLSENVAVSSLLSGPIAKHFYKQVSGFDQPVANLVTSVTGACLLVLMAATVFVASKSNRVVVAFSAVVLAALGWYAGLDFFRGWPILQLALIPFALRRPREPLLILLVMSLCASSRVFLRMTPQWYGFVFLVPAYALFAYVVMEWLPERGWYSRRAALLWLVPIAIVSAELVIVERSVISQKQFAVRTTRGTFYEANPDKAAILNQFFSYAAATKMESLVIVPEGLALNYLASVPTPLRFHTFTPIEAANPAIEKQIVDEMRAKPPQYVAVVSRVLTDFGYRGFGLDYDRDLAAFIRQRYVVEQSWQRPGFAMVLLRKR